MRKFLIQNKGGKCEICGYSKNASALSFHHEDPKEKRFTLGLDSLMNRNKEELLKESLKCKLLCANCHMELHYPHYNL